MRTSFIRQVFSNFTYDTPIIYVKLNNGQDFKIVSYRQMACEVFK